MATFTVIRKSFLLVLFFIFAELFIFINDVFWSLYSMYTFALPKYEVSVHVLRGIKYAQ